MTLKNRTVRFALLATLLTPALAVSAHHLTLLL